MTEASEVPFGLEVTKGLVAKFLMAAIGFIGTIIFARILGPVTFGGFYLLWSIVDISKLPVDGFATASNKRVSETDANQCSIAGAILLLITCIGIISAIAAITLQGLIISFTGLENASLLFVILFVSVSLFSPFQGMLTGTGRISLSIWIDLLRSILTTPLQLAFVLLNFGASGMAYGLSLATLFTVPVTHYFLRIIPQLPDRETLNDLWVFARHSIVSATFGRVYNRLDILLLGLLLSPSAAGQYEVALKLTVPAVLVSEVMGTGMMARISNLRSKNEPVGSDVTNALSYASVFAIPLSFGAAVLSQPLIVTIYGPEYKAAAPLLIGIGVYRVLSTQTTPLTHTINGVDYPKINVKISALSLFVNIVLGVTLIIQIGALGVVLATVVAEAVKYCATAYKVKCLVPDARLLPRPLLDQTAVAGGMSIVVILAHHVIPVRSWLHLLSLVGLGAVVYGVGMIVLSPRIRLTVISILDDAGFTKWLPDNFTNR